MPRRVLKALLLTMLTVLMVTSIPDRRMVVHGEDDGTVYVYEIVGVYDLGGGTIQVDVKVQFCPGCNPNSAGSPGCDPFTHDYPPPHYPYSGYCGGADGRYVAVLLRKGFAQTGELIAAPQKIICTPSNCPLAPAMPTVMTFMFTGVPVSPSDTVVAEADVYCSFCGHWFPMPFPPALPPPSPYDVTINAHCYTEGVGVSVSITMDGSPTGYTTPHAFTGLTGIHTFTVPDTDSYDHAFWGWNTGETATTITVTSGGTYTAFYGAMPGPTTVHLEFKTILGPDSQVRAMKTGEADVVSDLIRPTDKQDLATWGARITYTSGFHMAYIGFNLRRWYFGPQDGTGPAQSLRQAIAYLLPKDALIATLFKYMCETLDQHVPNAMAMWRNFGAARYDFDPKAAYDKLYNAGYRYDIAGGTWRAPGPGGPGTGQLLPVFDVLSPLYEVAPTSAAIAAALVGQMNGLKNPYTGAATPLKAEHSPTDFWTIVERAFAYHNFDMYFGEWDAKDIGRFADFLYRFYHSSQDIEWGGNAFGIHNDELDRQLEILQFSMYHDARVTAAKEAQRLLGILMPNIPIYSRNYESAYLPTLRGIAESPGFGSTNSWTYMNIEGNRPSTLVTKARGFQVDGNQTIFTSSEKVESWNPALAGSVYAWSVLSRIYDSLIMVNPYTHEDMPWLARSWTITGPVTMTTPHGANMVNGMVIDFVLDDAVGMGLVKWHDGEVFDAYDIEWGWRFVWEDELPTYLTFWEHLIDTNVVDSTHLSIYFSTTSQWLLYQAAEVGVIFAPQVWAPLKGTGATNIQNFHPELHLRSEIGTYPAQAAYPWLTQVIGQGPFVYYVEPPTAPVDPFNNHVIAFDTRTHRTVQPDIHYWKPTFEIRDQKAEMFHRIGDVNRDFVINIIDLATICWSFYARVGSPRYIPDADIYPDGIINIWDLAICAMNYGKIDP